MYDRQVDDAEETGLGTLAATLTALLVLVAIVVLFLVLKFNLVHGGKPGNLPTTAPLPRAVVRLL